MAENNNFCFHLKSLEEKVKVSWQELQMENEFHDVTLACEDKTIRTHRLIISSFSPVLRNILKLLQTPHPLIYLQKVKFKNLQSLLHFMYKGEVVVSEEDISGFFEVAEDLNVKGLSERNTEDIQISRFNQENIESLPKIKITSKNSSDNNSLQQFTNVEIDSHNFISDDNNTNKFSSLPEIKSKFYNQEITENSTNNVISAIPETQFSCKTCNKIFSRRYVLKMHIQSIHEGRRYLCSQCNYKATDEGNLQKHIKSIHEQERYPCGECDYKATQKGNLHRHQNKQHN